MHTHACLSYKHAHKDVHAHTGKHSCINPSPPHTLHLQVSAGSEPSAIGRSVSAAVRNKGSVGWADDVVGGERDSGGVSPLLLL